MMYMQMYESMCDSMNEKSKNQFFGPLARQEGSVAKNAQCNPQVPNDMHCSDTLCEVHLPLPVSLTRQRRADDLVPQGCAFVLLP